MYIRDGETTIRIKFACWGHRGREENRPKTLFALGKCLDNKILKVLILLLRKFVVIAQAPSVVSLGRVDLPNFRMATVRLGLIAVRLRFVHGAVRAVPVFGSDGSLGERVFSVLQYILAVSVS